MPSSAEVDGQCYFATYDSKTSLTGELYQCPSSVYEWAKARQASAANSNVMAMVTSKPTSQQKGQPYLLCWKGNPKRHYFGIKEAEASCCMNLCLWILQVLLVGLIVGIFVGLPGVCLGSGLFLFTWTERSPAAVFITVALLYVAWVSLAVVYLFWHGYREATTHPTSTTERDAVVLSAAEQAALAKLSVDKQAALNAALDQKLGDTEDALANVAKD